MVGKRTTCGLVVVAAHGVCVFILVFLKNFLGWAGGFGPLTYLVLRVVDFPIYWFSGKLSTVVEPPAGFL